MKLKKILIKIKVDNNLNYLNDLIKNPEVNNLIRNVIKKYHSNHKEIKELAETMTKEITIKYYNYQESDYVEDQYLHYLRKSLGRRVRIEFYQDKPQEEIDYGLGNEYDSICECNDFTDSIIEKIDLYNALDKLEPDERYVIEKIFFDGFTEEKIAENFGVTRQNINKIKNKALIKLKNLLK